MTFSAASFFAAATNASIPPNASAEVAVFASAAPDDPEAAGVVSSSLGGEQATTVAAAKPIMARAPARRMKEWVIVDLRVRGGRCRGLVMEALSHSRDQRTGREQNSRVLWETQLKRDRCASYRPPAVHRPVAPLGRPMPRV